MAEAGQGSYGQYDLFNGTIAVNTNQPEYPEVKIGKEGAGYFNQYAGAVNASASAVYLGDASSGLGVYTITGGNLSAAELSLGESGTGYVYQQSGNVKISNILALAKQEESSGFYYLSGDGDLSTAYLKVGMRGSGMFSQSGGHVDVVEVLTIGGEPCGSGKYELSGGDLVSLRIDNHDQLLYSGGTLKADIVNSDTGIVTISGPGPRVIDGSVTNNGVFKATGTTVEYTGMFENNAEYQSDPSVNIFHGDLVIGDAGYLIGSVDDVFEVHGSLISKSIQSGVWRTDESTLRFINDSGKDGYVHKFSITGQDIGGADEQGYSSNFAWGVLELGKGDVACLQEGEAGGILEALYVREIKNVQITGGEITNIYGNNLNIYYLPDFNPLLEKKTYNLQNGGQLKPIGVVPEPVSTSLFLLGGAILLVRRRFKR
jgi:hypothetical protein